jgi:hypothetical protein
METIVSLGDVVSNVNIGNVVTGVLSNSRELVQELGGDRVVDILENVIDTSTEQSAESTNHSDVAANTVNTVNTVAAQVAANTVNTVSTVSTQVGSVSGSIVSRGLTN